VQGKDGKKNPVGHRLIFIGASLSLFVFLYILYTVHAGMVASLWFAIASSLIASIPSLVIGIILVANP
jgi:hypothetical protein